MSTAYGGLPGDGKVGADRLAYLPVLAELENGRKVELDFFRKDEYEQGRWLMNHVIEEGLSWPFEKAMTLDEFRGYFLSHAAFVVREVVDGSAEQPQGTTSGSVLGAFYVKPNYPGRCGHICNGGFITHPDIKRQGIATLMAVFFLRIARDIGFKASYFNLVFESNVGSLVLWRKLGFNEVGRIPNAARLKDGREYTDALQFHYDLDGFDFDSTVATHLKAKLLPTLS